MFIVTRMRFLSYASAVSDVRPVLIETPCMRFVDRELQKEVNRRNLQRRLSKISIRFLKSLYRFGFVKLQCLFTCTPTTFKKGVVGGSVLFRGRIQRFEP